MSRHKDGSHGAVEVARDIELRMGQEATDWQIGNVFHYYGGVVEENTLTFIYLTYL
ncbi:hypothetical protein ACS0TY_022333 [Phlomoides rotata]